MLGVFFHKWLPGQEFHSVIKRFESGQRRNVAYIRALRHFDWAAFWPVKFFLCVVFVIFPPSQFSQVTFFQETFCQRFIVVSIFETLIYIYTCPIRPKFSCSNKFQNRNFQFVKLWFPWFLETGVISLRDDEVKISNKFPVYLHVVGGIVRHTILVLDRRRRVIDAQIFMPLVYKEIHLLFITSLIFFFFSKRKKWDWWWIKDEFL